MSNTTYRFDGLTDKKISVKLLYISSAKYGHDWHSTVHDHNFTELFYILNGQGSFIINKHSYPVQEDDIIMISPFIDHTENSVSSNPLEYIALGIEGLVFISNADEEKSRGYYIFNYREKREEILFYLKALLKEINKKEKNFETVCQNLLELFIINTIRHSNYELSLASYAGINRECASIKEYIDNNFKEDITLDSLAERAHMNKYYLSHVFQEYIGIPPIKYLNQKRIDESKHLLESTNYSILQVSSIVGFSSQSYFSQTFKKTCGKSPIEYRKNCNWEK